jgi:hypothetical protein
LIIKFLALLLLFAGPKETRSERTVTCAHDSSVRIRFENCGPAVVSLQRAYK